MVEQVHKDLLYNHTEGIIRQELRDAKLVNSEGSEEELTTFAFLTRELGLKLDFGTIDDVFSSSQTSQQPLYYTSNLNHVLSLAQEEGRSLDIMAGVCLMGNRRIVASNGDFCIGLPPFGLKEFDPEARFSINDILEFHQQLRGCGFPGDKPNIGRLSDYSHVHPSFVSLEPSLGKVLKFFNYFEIAENIGALVRIVLPTGEYKRDTLPLLDNTPFDAKLVEADIENSSRVFQKTIEAIRDIYYPHASITYEDTANPSVRVGLDKVMQNDEFLNAVHKLGKNSYGVQNWHEFGETLDRLYSSLFLSAGGRLLTGEDSDSRVIFVHARDLTSFALQSLWVYEQLVLDKQYSWKDRIAVVGVSGGSAYRIINDEERRKYLNIGYRLVEDDYLSFGDVCLFLRESDDETERKVNEMVPVSKKRDPLFAYIRRLHNFIDSDNEETRRYIETYSARNKVERCEEGKPILIGLIKKLKENIGPYLPS